jgi:glycosyltransferase involved in cell wall biosynthesis
MLPILRPDVFLAQSRRWISLFKASGSQVIDFPNWVSEQKFQLRDPSAALTLRKKHGLPLQGQLVLHIGPVKPNRNLECLIAVQKSNRYQVVVIGSESLSQEGAHRDRLEAAGILVRIGYVKDIQEVYQACDFYALTAKAMPAACFPRHRHAIGVIDFPVSILEAMACGLRVVTTRHDALEYFLGQPAGLRYFDGCGSDCLRALDELVDEPADTRSVATRFALDNAVNILDKVYQSLGRRAQV